jgi:hypothetical protein
MREPQPTDGLKEAVVGHGKGGRPPAPRTTERFKFGEVTEGLKRSS